MNKSNKRSRITLVVLALVVVVVFAYGRASNMIASRNAENATYKTSGVDHSMVVWDDAQRLHLVDNNVAGGWQIREAVSVDGRKLDHFRRLLQGDDQNIILASSGEKGLYYAAIAGTAQGNELMFKPLRKGEIFVASSAFDIRVCENGDYVLTDGPQSAVVHMENNLPRLQMYSEIENSDKKSSKRFEYTVSKGGQPQRRVFLQEVGAPAPLEGVHMGLHDLEKNPTYKVLANLIRQQK